MSALGELVVSLSANTAKFHEALDKASWKSKQSMDAMLKAADVAGKAIGASIVAGATAAAYAMQQIIDASDELAKSAQKVGMTVEALSRLQYAADLSGVSAQELQASILKMNKAAADGSDAFKAMGIATKNADGSLKSSNDLLGEVADKFAGYRDSAEKSALAMEIFGKSGATLIPFLNGGAAGLKEMGDEAQTFGIVVSTQAAKAAEQFNDNITRLQATQRGLLQQLTEQMLPTLVTFSDEAVRLGKEFNLITPIANGLKLVFQTLAVLAAEVAFVFKGVGTEIGGIAAQVVSFLTGNWKEALKIGDMMKEDAAKARAEQDALIARLMGVGDAAKGAGDSVQEFGTKGAGAIAPTVKGFGDIATAAEKMRKAINDAAKANWSMFEKWAAEGQKARDSVRTPIEALEAEFQRIDNLFENPATGTTLDDWVRLRAKAIEDYNAKLAQAQTYEPSYAGRVKETSGERMKALQQEVEMLTLARSMGEITEQAYTESLQNIGGEMSKLVVRYDTEMGLMESIAQNAAKSIQQSMADFLFDPFSRGLKGMLKGFIDMIRRMIAEAAAAKLMQAVVNWGQSYTGGGWVQNIANFAASMGKRASGGPVSGGTPYLVGERGPEIFVPGQSGGIVPNHAIGQQAAPVQVVQNINISTGVAQTVRAEIMSMMPRISEAAKSAVADAKLRGGSYAAAMR